MTVGVVGPYLTLIAFLAAAVMALAREFPKTRGLDRAWLLARMCLAVPIAVFGADHLTSPQSISKVVPAWMPDKLFWTYFVGGALVAAAISLIFRKWVRLSAALLGIMLWCFVVLIHIPNAIATPQSRFAWAIVARDSAFGAGALLLAVRGRLADGASYIIALVCLFFGIESLLHPECVPAVPLAKVTPLWIPLAHFWTVLTGIGLIACGGAMLARKGSRWAAGLLGAWVVLLVLTVYLAIMLAKPDVEDLNYFADTLMFGGALLAAAWGGRKPLPR
jgi:uncharacterized membrane protein